LTDEMEAIDTDWQTPTGLPFQPRLDRGVDGDAADLGIDLGSRTRTTVRMRMKGIDTADVYVASTRTSRRTGAERSIPTLRAPGLKKPTATRGPFLLGPEKDHGTYRR
jgi:hypothetical protein